MQIEKKNHKRQAIAKLEEDKDKIPRSAKINFKLQPCKEVEALSQFAEIKMETDALLDKFQKDLKEQILKVAKLEIAIFEQDLRVHFADIIKKTVEAFLLAKKILATVKSKLLLTSFPTIKIDCI